MTSLHDSALSRPRLIGGYVLTVLPSLMILYSGTMKLFMAPSMVNNMAELGLEAATIWIGLIELGVMVLYWIPLTSNLGFCLLSAYLGGIIVAELMTGSPAVGLTLATVFYTGTFLRKPSLFGLNF